MDNQSFLNKVVVVTGGSSGIGKGIVQSFAKEGAKVVIADINEKAGLRTFTELKEGGYECIFIKCDVRKVDEIKLLMEISEKTFGTIHVLINNAGVSKWEDPFILNENDWDDVMNTNLKSVFFASREAARVMKEHHVTGSIINLASTRAFMSEKHSEAYAATKGGIVALTHALAASFAEYKITVNSISPGWIETGEYELLREIDHEQHLSKRVGKPEDIANACLYLAQEKNNFVNGTNLVIDGGMTRKMMYEE
ncbi:glucose 1-dehydrogenase [Bacillus suaedaesalsae]|uniref:Glucose 1-dehydrogenase n=1 Tax=Bacillus suaedaesalsae TaxID=2810349 RepID=A0ABS2DGI1_9BACI|nr:glucose 1-dehydrogenase [Bacillus suaedaesalsae]MBM6617568.1 glucose 1-dehydrogenase [Bacillus suaedaesalsae]